MTWFSDPWCPDLRPKSKTKKRKGKWIHRPWGLVQLFGRWRTGPRGGRRRWWQWWTRNRRRWRRSEGRTRIRKTRSSCPGQIHYMYPSRQECSWLRHLFRPPSKPHFSGPSKLFHFSISRFHLGPLVNQTRCFYWVKNGISLTTRKFWSFYRCYL